MTKVHKLSFVDNFSTLGLYLKAWLNNECVNTALDIAVERSMLDNEYFTPFMQKRAIENIADNYLDKDSLNQWLNIYSKEIENIKYEATVGIIMAGNIPLVGFHDLLCVLAIGAKAAIKLSSKDKHLMEALIGVLVNINSDWKEKIIFCHNVKELYSIKPVALIATGASNTVETIRKECGNLPLLSRGSRFSFAVLTGNETELDLEALAQDAFLYFGMGCRSITYLLLPKSYCFDKLLLAFAKWEKFISCQAYSNMYKRLRAILKLEGETFIDGNFFILRQTNDLWANRAEIRYRFYSSIDDILGFETEFSAFIQKKYTTFGLAQRPKIGEYADNKDTIKFLLKVIN